jgi:AraC-like DNA-binding protein
MFSNELVCNIVEYLNNNINKEITIDELSLLFYFNKTYIMKRFKKELNISIHEYINTIRIYNSLIYFRNDNYILSIAFKNGFNSLEYFSETFKKIMGVSPMIYKKYLNYKYITEKELQTILENITRINNIKNKVLNYFNHRKPTHVYVKKLSLEQKGI